MVFNTPVPDKHKSAQLTHDHAETLAGKNSETFNPIATHPCEWVSKLCIRQGVAGK